MLHWNKVLKFQKVFHSTHLAKCAGNEANGKETPWAELYSDGSFHVGKRTVETRFIFSTSVGLSPASQMMLLVISKCVLTGSSKPICTEEELRSPSVSSPDVNIQSEKNWFSCRTFSLSTSAQQFCAAAHLPVNLAQPKRDRKKEHGSVSGLENKLRTSCDLKLPERPAHLTLCSWQVWLSRAL